MRKFTNIFLALTMILAAGFIFTSCGEDEPDEPTVGYVFGSSTLDIDSVALVRGHGGQGPLGITFYGEGFPGAEGVNKIMAYPNMGMGDLAGSYTWDTTSTAGEGTFTYSLWANQVGYSMDSIGMGVDGTLMIKLMETDNYEIELKSGNLEMFVMEGWNMVPTGTKPKFSIYYKGYVKPEAAK